MTDGSVAVNDVNSAAAGESDASSMHNGAPAAAAVHAEAALAVDNGEGGDVVANDGVHDLDMMDEDDAHSSGSRSSGLSGCSASSSNDEAGSVLQASACQYEPPGLPATCHTFVGMAVHVLINTLAAPKAQLRLRSLTIYGLHFSNAQAAALGAVLRTQTQLQLQRLGLRCRMAPADAVLVLGAVATLPHVRALELHNAPCWGSAGASKLLVSLSRLSRLTYLRLAEQRCFHVRASEITAALSPLTALRHLALLDCFSSTVRGALAAVPHMRRMESISCYNLYGDSLRLRPGTPAAWDAVATASATLTRLTLSGQKTGGSACTALRRLVALTALQHLDITGWFSRAMARGNARALADALDAMAHLTHLNISAHARFWDAGRFEVLAPVIARLTALRELGLKDALGFNADNQNSRAQHLCGLKTLRVLSLNNSVCCGESSAALARWLGALPALEEVSLLESDLSSVSAAALCSALACSASVTYLDLLRLAVHYYCTPSLGSDLQAFGAALGGLVHLQVLNSSFNGIDFTGLQSMGTFEENLSELRCLSMAGNALCVAVFDLLGQCAAGLPKLGRLDVSDQWMPAGAEVGLRELTIALRMHRAPQQVLVVAYGCTGCRSKALETWTSQVMARAQLQGRGAPRVEF